MMEFHNRKLSWAIPRIMYIAFTAYQAGICNIRIKSVCLLFIVLCIVDAMPCKYYMEILYDRISELANRLSFKYKGYAYLLCIINTICIVDVRTHWHGTQPDCMVA